MQRNSFTRADLAGFGVGFASLWIQVVLIRRLFGVFNGNELTIGAALSMWMVGTGLGSLVLGRLSDRTRDPGRALAVVFIMVCLLFVPLALATARIKPWLGLGQGELAGLPAVIFSAFILTGPVAALLGFAFNLAGRLQQDFKTAAGRTYRFESGGAFLAGVVLALWFSGKASPLLPALIISLLVLVLAFILLDAFQSRPRGIGAAILILVLLMLTLVFNQRLERWYERMYWQDRETLACFDSRYGYLAATVQADQITIYQDGSPAASFPDPAAAEILANLPLAMVEHPRNILLIGGGLTNLATEILRHPVKRLDYLQLDPGFLELERRFAPGFSELDKDARVSVHRGDGRAWLKSRPGAYDAIIVNLPDPLSAGLSRFYSAEFMAEARAALAPAGVLAFTVGATPPNRRYSPGQLGLLAGALKTVDSVFPQKVIFTLAENLVVAGDDQARLISDPKQLQAVLSLRGIDCYYSCASMIESDLGPDLGPDLDQRLDRADVKIDRDLAPRGYLYGIMLYAEKVSPQAGRIISALLRLPRWSIGVIPLAVLILGGAGIGLAGTKAEAGLAAFGSGFCAIVIEVAVIIAYQVLAGALFFALALLTASFMVGLALGAWLWELMKPRLNMLIAEAVLVFCSVGALTMIYVIYRAGPGGLVTLIVSCAILLCQGAAAGIVFSEAAHGLIQNREEVGRGLGWVYGLELIGSATGGLIAVAVAIPVFGILWTMALALITALAVLAASLVGRRIKRA